MTTCPTCLSRLALGRTPAHRYAVGRAAGHQGGHAMYRPPADMPGEPEPLCEAAELWRPRKAQPRRLLRVVVARRGGAVVAARRDGEPEPPGWPWDASERVEVMTAGEFRRLTAPSAGQKGER